MSADDDIDRLYAVDPTDFTGLRKELAAAARKRGDADAAKLIAAARRPTTAAWVVNALVRHDGTVRARLGDLAEQLRAAHASMDGARIRELSTAQRKLVDGLVRTAFTATGQSRPPAALRDDVTGTLQAAIADPDVASRLGRLVKAEQWSGFGEFGALTAAGEPRPRGKVKPPQPVRDTDATAAAAARDVAKERLESARAEAKAAEQAHSGADEALAERSATLATARRRYEKLLATLSVAEGDVDTADAQYADAEKAEKAAADRLEAAKTTLAQTESELAALEP